MSEETSFEDKISMFLRRNFPQIEMHGGESSILVADEDEGRVEIALGGACSGCGISPMTVQMIKSRLIDEVEAVETVNVSTGMDGGGGFGTTTEFDETTDDSSEPNVDAPF